MVVLYLPVNIIFVRGYAEAGKGNLYPTQAPGFVPIQKKTTCIAGFFFC